MKKTLVGLKKAKMWEYKNNDLIIDYLSGRLEPRTITDSMNEQIKFCNSQGLSFKISAWDWMIKCIPID